MSRKIIFYSAALLLLLVGMPKFALAHCPLCTVGIGMAAAGAIWLGINIVAIGLFVGAFALALGLWMNKIIKKKFFKGQRIAVGLASFVLTVIPLSLAPIFQSYTSIYINISGDYGSWLNRTYLINLFILGSIMGACVLLVSPYISNLITKFRQGKRISFQGLIVTLCLLFLTALIIQFYINQSV